MNVRIFWVRAMKCMCAQTRPRFILSSERVLGGMEFEPMLTPSEKSPLPENVPRGGSNPQHCGQRAQALPTELFRPLSINNNNNCIERRNSRFFTISSLRRELSPKRTLKWPVCNRVQIMCNTSSVYHMQHAVCHLVRRDSSAIKMDRVEIAFILALSLLAETINLWMRRGNQSTHRKPLTTSFRKCHILKPENSSPKRDSNPHSSIGDRLGKQTC